MAFNFIRMILVKLITFYCQISPIEPGKSRLQQVGIRLLRKSTLLAISHEGHKFQLEFPRDKGWDTIYFRHTFETGTVEALKKIVQETDTVIDIGANIGWYTMLFTKLLIRGQCHSFEPNPPIYNQLVINSKLNNVSKNIFLNQIALGAKEGRIDLHVFPDLGHGHSSISTLGYKSYTTVSVPITTLDHYISQHQIHKVDIIKMDVEGAELDVLRGASQLLSSALPPIWVIEMNVETSASFGHTPTELLEFIQSYGPYSFYRIAKAWGKLSLMQSVEDYSHGDNVICIPSSQKAKLELLQQLTP